MLINGPKSGGKKTRESHLFHGFELSGGADAGDGETDVNGRSDTFVKQLSLQENLQMDKNELRT